MSNPRYTGRQVWNRKRTDKDLADPADVSLGHKSVQRWNLPDGWVISRKPAHAALVSEADFIAAQDISAARGPAPGGRLTAPQQRCYLLAGLLVCGGCGRRMESAWSNGKPAMLRVSSRNDWRSMESCSDCTTELLDNGGDDLADAALQLAIVRDRRRHRDLGRIDRRNSERDQLRCIDQ